VDEDVFNSQSGDLRHKDAAKGIGDRSIQPD
jgi:hypothetical protein